MKSTLRLALAALGLGLIFIPFNLGLLGKPGLLLTLSGGIPLYKLRLHHTLADPTGITAIAAILILPHFLTAGPMLTNTCLAAFAGLAIYSGRSGVASDCKCE